MYWLRARVHPMWQVAALSVGILCGVAAAMQIYAVTTVAIPVAAMVCMVVIMLRSRRWLLMAALIIGILLGLWRGGIVQQDMQAYRSMMGARILLSGRVRDDPETNKRGDLVLRVDDIASRGVALPGAMWVTVANAKNIQRSDRVVLDGKLEEGFGNFVATMKLPTVRDVTREQPGDIALTIRNDFSDHVSRAIHGSAARLGEGFLLGQNRGLPEELTTALKVAGLTHIVVASGYNLTILVRFARRLFEKHSKFLSVFISLLMISGFISITGMSPSMTRAGLVSVLALWAWYYGRRFHPIVLLAFAGAITVMVNPSYLWGDLGWMLSFAAFGGVMIVAPLLHAYFYGNDKPHTIAQILLETLSAQLMALPIILVTFGQMSNVAPLANLLIVPFVPLAMVLVLVAGIAEYIAPGIAPIVAWPAQTLLDAMIAVVHWCANLSWAQVDMSLSVWGAGLLYAIILASCVYMWRITQYKFHKSSIVE